MDRSMLQTTLLLLLLQLARSTTPDLKVSTNRTTNKLQPLCDMGCKCPADDQSPAFLDCSKLAVQKLPAGLSVPPSVTGLSFQGNLIGALGAGAFAGAGSVEELDLSLNRIGAVDGGALAALGSLSRLQLSHNVLFELAPGMLRGATGLRVLELGHNKIQKMSPDSFRDSPDLRELRLQYNPVFELPEGIFRFLPRLQKLDLQETGLVTLPGDLFAPTPGLRWLSLSNNAFETVPQGALSRASLLERLDLSGNDFRVLAEGAFQGLSNVTVLFLNSLPFLSRIEKNSLSGLDRLKTFACSYNPRLRFIDEDAFGTENSTKTPPHEQLYLRQNALRTLQAPLQKEELPSLSFVDLTDNPWHCDCNLDWMAFLRKEHQRNVICQSPAYLQGRSFDTLQLAELKCGDKWNNVVFITVVSSMVAFAIVMVALSAVVCSRSRVGLLVRAKKQFSYAKVTPGAETVDLEWDPSADI